MPATATIFACAIDELLDQGPTCPVNEPLLPFRLLRIHATQSRHAVPSLGKAIDLRLFDYEHFRDLHNFPVVIRQLMVHIRSFGR